MRWWHPPPTPQPTAATVLPFPNYIRQSLTAPLRCMKYRLSCIPSATRRTFRQASAMRNHGDLLTIFPILIQIKVQTWKQTANYYSPTPLLIIESRLGWRKGQVLCMLLLMEGRNKWKWLSLIGAKCMNQFPLCAAEKSLSFVIRSQTISCPIKVHVIQYLECQGTAVEGGKKKSSLLPSRWVFTSARQ